MIAFINFEKRQNNVEKVKELYFKAYTNALERNQSEAMAYIVVQYSRFLAFKCSDPNRAVEIMNQAISKCSTIAEGSRGTKTLYLSYVNFLKHLEGQIPDTFSKIVQVFDKGIESGLSIEDRAEIARFYIEYLQESSPSVSQLRSTEASLKQKGLLTFKPDGSR